MKKQKGFTLIELLVVIAIIALLMAIIIPALHTARKIATSAVCMGNQRTLITGWIMYADDNDSYLVNCGACYDTPQDKSPWVHRPKNPMGNNLPNNPAPPTITNEDRFRGIKAGTLWRYIKDVGAYHCPGDNRRSTQLPPRDCFRSYTISYAFGRDTDTFEGCRIYKKLNEVKSGALYYVFVEEEHNGSRYGENEGGWAIRAVSSRNPSDWAFYDPLASYHNKSSTFSFADGHADRRRWMDERTLQFIETNAREPGSHSGIRTSSPGNEDLKWLIEHFIGPERK